MNSYPAVVAKIADDYLDRVELQLRLTPVREEKEFLAEIESHLFEAYQQRPEEDEVARILAVLRSFGEPAEVVADRLPGTMARSGARRNAPLYILGGFLLAMFAIPLGFGAFGALTGILAGLAGIVVAFYATAGSIVLVGALFAMLGLTRMLLPQFFDRLIMLDYVRISAPTAEFLDHFSRPEQNLLIILFGCVWLAGGFGMLWLGRYLFRGLRFLFLLIFDWMRRFTQGFRARLRQEKSDAPYMRQTARGLADLPKTGR
jgi:uncharacterized membrane protein